jgi:hypothetical protein
MHVGAVTRGCINIKLRGMQQRPAAAIRRWSTADVWVGTCAATRESSERETLHPNTF